MKIKYTIILALFVIFSPNISYSNDEPVRFNDDHQEKRYYKLIEEVRCLVCQNQSLADSNAPLAQDLREQIFQMIKSKKTNNEILDFLVHRYGDFVLYRPPLKKDTWLLWFGPFLILTIAIISTFFFIKKQASNK
ncbi:MAG: cytochrome c-type biogenesis protein [Gammaproteobacteria bacterium]|tara:strand:- start:1073 stop:1477 length:405 start_codon:yes stop_codon:yes gene_type:complete